MNENDFNIGDIITTIFFFVIMVLLVGVVN